MCTDIKKKNEGPRTTLGTPLLRGGHRISKYSEVDDLYDHSTILG